MFIKWEENLDTESSETAVHEISTSPSSSKRQREHEEQYFDAPDTETRDDAHAHENRVPSSSTVIDLEHSNHVHANHHENTAAMYNHNHNSSNHNTNIISNNQHPPIFPTYRMPFQYPPQHCNLIASNDSEQIRKKQKKLQKRQAEERFSQTLNILLEEQKETVVSKRKTEDKHVLLEEERLLLEKKKLALEERRIALEEKKEERLAFFATLEKLGSADPEYSELMSLFIKKQLSCE
jgi:hypothetical protein